MGTVTCCSFARYSFHETTSPPAGRAGNEQPSFAQPSLLLRPKSKATEGRPETGNRQPATSNESYELTIRLPDNLATSVVPKGSIAIDGVSLTMTHVEGSTVTIAVIPHTLRETTLGNLHEGGRVNIETDVLLRRHVL